MGLAQAARRPIEGAVATAGVSDRVAFLRRTYAHLGFALVAFVLVTAAMMRYATELSLRLSLLGGHGAGSLLLLMLMFVAVNYGAQRLATSETSPGLQYLGLGIAVVAWSVWVQGLIWMVLVTFGHPGALLAGGSLHAALSGKAALVLGEATAVTLAIFIGLTVTVFVTRKDFSFLRGALSIGAFAMIGIALAAILFGFNIGMLYCAFGALLMAGYILYETSQIMSYFRPTQHVAAALMLFTTVVTLFIYVLRIVSEMNRR